MPSPSSDLSAMPDFDELADLFTQLGALGSPSECHGLLCGHLSAGARLESAAWLAMVGQQQDLEQIEGTDAQRLLADLYRASLARLEDMGFAFNPLLPDEQAPLAQRVEALGHWCQGFLSGFGLAYKRTEAELSEEARGALRDFAEIALVAEDTESTEENEADLMEVFEYVRMAALLVFNECNGTPDSEAPTQTLH